MWKLLVVLLLSGCASQSEEQAERYIAHYGPACAQFYDTGSDKWKQCVIDGVSEEFAQRRPNLLQSLGQGLSAAGGTLNPQVYQNAPYNGPINTNCTTTYLGTSCTTTPY